jgi:hypothetical protein
VPKTAVREATEAKYASRWFDGLLDGANTLDSLIDLSRRTSNPLDHLVPEGWDENTFDTLVRQLSGDLPVSAVDIGKEVIEQPPWSAKAEFGSSHALNHVRRNHIAVCYEQLDSSYRTGSRKAILELTCRREDDRHDIGQASLTPSNIERRLTVVRDPARVTQLSS